MTPQEIFQLEQHLEVSAKRDADKKFCSAKSIIIPHDKEKMGPSTKIFQILLKNPQQFELTGIFVIAHYFLLSQDYHGGIQYGSSQECESWFPVIKGH